MQKSVYYSDATTFMGVRTDGVAVTGTEVAYSKKFGPEGSTGFAYTTRWTGTPTGTLILQVSNKAYPLESSDADWDTDANNPTDPAGSASGASAELADRRSKWYRFKYTNSSGSGNLFAYITTEGG
jgi:hypothetical protein